MAEVGQLADKGWGTGNPGRVSGPTDESNPSNLIYWASGRQVVVEACTNLATATWIPVHTNTIAAGSVDFSDPRGTNAARFYRLRSL